MKSKLRIIVAGMVGRFPLGGVAWDYFHYLLALAELGHDVYYHEDTWCWPDNPSTGGPAEDATYTVNFIADFFRRYAPHLADRWHYFHIHDSHHGMTKEAFAEVAKTADIFLNVSGATFIPEELGERCVKVFMDTDPGYNQIVMATRPDWSPDVDRWVTQIRAHDRHLTYAENIYADDCLVPRMDFTWRPTRCVVTLKPWSDFKNDAPIAGASLSTIMSWGYFKGAVEHNGIAYDAKASEFEKFHDLPKHVRTPLSLAVGGHKFSADKIRGDGWGLIDAKDVTLDVGDYVKFIADSLGEWSIAKNVYVAPRTGWFSCRTACYLAAGRPAIVQDTAWSRYVPPGDGLFAFTTPEESIAAIEAVAADPLKHRAAAYERAVAYLAPDKVLPPMIETIFASEERSPLEKSLLPPL